MVWVSGCLTLRQCRFGGWKHRLRRISLWHVPESCSFLLRFVSGCYNFSLWPNLGCCNLLLFGMLQFVVMTFGLSQVSVVVVLGLLQFSVAVALGLLQFFVMVALGLLQFSAVVAVGLLQFHVTVAIGLLQFFCHDCYRAATILCCDCSQVVVIDCSWSRADVIFVVSAILRCGFDCYSRTPAVVVWVCGDMLSINLRGCGR